MATKIPDAQLDAWRGVLNVHAAVVERVEQDLAAAGLPPLTWYDVLWAASRAPGGRIRMAALADGLTVSRGGVTKLADRLERAGDDGRGVYAVVTADGRDMLRRMWRVYSKVLRETVVGAISDREAELIATGLERVLRRAQETVKSETAPA